MMAWTLCPGHCPSAASIVAPAVGKPAGTRVLVEAPEICWGAEVYLFKDYKEGQSMMCLQVGKVPIQRGLMMANQQYMGIGLIRRLEIVE